MKRLLALCLALPVLAGCAGSGETAAATTGAADPWTGHAPDGTTVRVVPGVTPVREGPVRFRIEITPANTPPSTVTVDLVSPSMPTHGVARFAAEPQTRGGYTAAVDIPMAGAWLLYVNLDDGGTAVPFAFEVGGAGGAHAHHTASDTPSPAHGGNTPNPGRD